MTERWAKITGTNYSISTLAQVRNDRTGRILKHLPNPGGYSMVALKYNGKIKRCYVHILVAEAFRGPRPSPRHEAAHCDGIRSHCELTNITWKTKEENWADRLIHGTHTRGEKNGRAKITEADVREIRRLRALGWLTRELRQKFGVGNISAIVKGKSWKYVN